MRNIQNNVDLRKSIGLLWCRWNAKQMNDKQFIQKIQKALGSTFIKSEWINYKKLHKLEKNFIKPTLKERILNEIVIKQRLENKRKWYKELNEVQE